MITKLDIIWSVKIGAKIRNLFFSANYFDNNHLQSFTTKTGTLPAIKKKHTININFLCFIKKDYYYPHMKQKITWLQILQGWSMLLVVVGHITLTGTFENPETPVSAAIETIIYSFHMPLFMFISGFLFYYTKISRNIAYKNVVIDKLKRLGIPFLFFTLFTFAVKFAFAPFMKRPVELSISQFVNSFLYPGSNPLSEMWFVATLFIIMLTYPLLKYMITSPFKIGILLLGCIALNLFFPADIELLCLSNVAYMLIFFCLGILFCQFHLHQYLSTPWIFIVLLALFCAFTLIPGCPRLLLNLSGILASTSLALNLAPLTPRLFASFRDYTFQIFLLGIFPQIAIRIVYTKIPHSEVAYWTLYLASILIGIYLPVLVAKIIKKIPSPLIHRCFGL